MTDFLRHLGKAIEGDYMSWSRFKFYCNEVARLIDRGEDVIPAFEIAKNSIISKEFGPELKSKEILLSILTTLKKEGYTKKEVVSILEIYDGINETELLHKPNRIRRVGIYMGYLAFMYFVLSSVYFSYVIPRTISMFEAMEIPPPERLIWFIDNWAAILAVVTGFILASFFVSRKIKEIFEYKKGIEKTIVYRFLIPKKIKSKYARLISLIHLPLHISRNTKDGVNDKIINHYYSENYTSKEVSGSLSILLNDNLRELVTMSESYMRRIYVVVAALIIFSIYEFVSSAYAPLFVMGEVV